ncbi:MAG TPA: response regulator [Tepidisphaeraceae bacterium]|jgi:DNA-binding response OmpR family regulator|nr:response regulator [Tepidisphaeraceae bacterium]
MARILIVDDHLETCRVMSLLVKHLGHEAFAINSGNDAIAFLKRSSVDLIILDIMMPVLSGMDVLRTLRRSQDTAMTPVIMMTAITDPLTRQEAMQAGANDYWVKATVDVTELEKRINYHVKRRATDDNERVGRVVGTISPSLELMQSLMSVSPMNPPTVVQAREAQPNVTWRAMLMAMLSAFRHAMTSGAFRAYSPSTSATV